MSGMGDQDGSIQPKAPVLPAPIQAPTPTIVELIVLIMTGAVAVTATTPTRATTPATEQKGPHFQKRQVIKQIPCYCPHELVQGYRVYIT